jgi:PAS domain S-box-containing protein
MLGAVDFVLCLTGPLLAASVFLVERRGQGRQLDPKRHLEISTLLESLPDGVLIFDAAARVVECNRAVEQVCGYGLQELRRFDLADLARFFGARQESGELMGVESLAVSRALRGEQVKNEARLLRNPRTGNEVEVLLSASPMCDANGAVIGALVIIRDVTQTAALQRRMADVERHGAIGQMAAGIAHDFNNVLDTIVQAVAIIELSGDKPRREQQIYLDMIKNAVRRGAEIISHIREYLRTGTGQFTLVHLDKLIDEVVDLTRPLWQVSGNIKFERQLQPVPPVRGVAADLRRVFTNLIINAIEAMPEGGTLTVGCQAKDGQAMAWFSDTGPGIAPENQKKIFYPYYTTKPGGTGLGLSGAQRIVLAHGGTISFASEPRKGTRFEVSLPLAKSHETTKAA